MCVVVLALVWIFGFQMNGDFWVSNERWLDGCLNFTDLCLRSRRVRRKMILLLLLLSLCVCVCVCCVFNELSVFFCPSLCYGFLMFYCIF